MRCGYKGLVFCRNNGWIMENMDKGLTVPKWVLIVRPEITQMPQNPFQYHTPSIFKLNRDCSQFWSKNAQFQINKRQELSMSWNSSWLSTLRHINVTYLHIFFKTLNTYLWGQVPFQFLAHHYEVECWFEVEIFA